MSFARRRLAWLAMWLQDRRRARAAAQPATPNAPVITFGWVNWDGTQPGWADIDLGWTFVHGSFPVATIELWKSVNGGAYSLLVTVASTASGYYYALACDINGGTFDFKTRYVNGGTVGPFSNIYRVDIVPS